jgi:hypothetical protein
VSLPPEFESDFLLPEDNALPPRGMVCMCTVHVYSWFVREGESEVCPLCLRQAEEMAEWLANPPMTVCDCPVHGS